jgi:hypothetical protein
MNDSTKAASALRLAEAIRRGCKEAHWDTEPIFTGEDSADPTGDEDEVFFTVTIGPEPVRLFTITVTDESLRDDVRRLNHDL